HKDGPLLIVAGAGTGKTTVVTQRILWLLTNPHNSPASPSYLKRGLGALQKGRVDVVKPENILAMTFTDKAAEEMVDRIDQLLPYGYTDLWVMTFHGFCERILKQHGLDIGIPNDFKLMNQTDAWFLVRKNLEEFSLDYYKPLGNPTKFIHALLQHFSRCKDEAVGPGEYLEYGKGLALNSDQETHNSPRPSYLKRGVPPLKVRGGEEELCNTDSKRINEIAEAYHVYQQQLLDNNALDFGDLLLYTLKLFRERPNILKQYQEQFKYVLVDEFQDTNWVQYELVKLLAAPRNNLTVVADDDQAIYQWRGASVSNVLRFKDDYPKSEQVVLVENYRSQQNILDTAYAFIQKNNPYRLEYQLSTVEDIVKHAKERGVALKNFKPINKKLKAMVGGEGVIEHIHAGTQEEEARMVVEKILELQRPDLRKSENRSLVSWSDFAILVRANSQANVFMRALDAADIPYQFMASEGLYAKPVVLDLLAYLRLLDNYHESPAVYRVLNWSVLGIAPGDIATLLQVARRKSWSLYEVLKQLQTIGGIAPDTRRRVTELLGWIERHRSLSRDKTAGQVLLAILEDTGYLKALTKASEKDRRALDAVGAIRQLYKKIEAFERTAKEPTVQHFMEYMDLALESGDEGSLEQDVESGPETVKILTVHGAKGLEFAHVFIVNLVELRFPSMDRKDPIQLPEALVKEIAPDADVHIQEERRLFYVAMTRAKHGLYFTSADDYGGTRKKKASRFLEEAGIASKQRATRSLQLATDRKPEARSQKPEAVHLPDQFSYTQLKAFETCPYQYRFAHILKIPVRGKGTFSFGRTMHLTLQRFFQGIIERNQQEQGTLFDARTEERKNRRTKALSVVDLLKIYDECWIDEWYESKAQKEEYREKGSAILKEFYAKHEGAWPTPQALEKSFMVKIGDVVLKGTIDRIDPLNDGVEIVDYKTGKPKSEMDGDTKEQLLIYQIAATEVLGEKPKFLSYWYFDNNSKVSFLGTAEEIEGVKAKIVATVDAMKTSDFAATPSPYVCKHCDFKEICEYRQI
ncbi:ATP-dependent helicase, partial [Candidatus Uhrbacteria bacterium]|nr:ATP-dependent helicase [Candidatus Uhrbacteria bacterium]